jgi:hypothetical protein
MPLDLTYAEKNRASNARQLGLFIAVLAATDRG